MEWIKRHWLTLVPICIGVGGIGGVIGWLRGLTWDGISVNALGSGALGAIAYSAISIARYSRRRVTATIDIKVHPGRSVVASITNTGKQFSLGAGQQITEVVSPHQIDTDASFPFVNRPLEPGQETEYLVAELTPDDRHVWVCSEAARAIQFWPTNKALDFHVHYSFDQIGPGGTRRPITKRRFHITLKRNITGYTLGVEQFVLQT